MRELEGRVWEGDGGRGDDGGGVGCKPVWRRRLSEGTARSGRRGFVYLVFVGIVCYYFVGLSGVFYWLVSEIVS